MYEPEKIQLGTYYEQSSNRPVTVREFAVSYRQDGDPQGSVTYTYNDTNETINTTYQDFILPGKFLKNPSLFPIVQTSHSPEAPVVSL